MATTLLAFIPAAPHLSEATFYSEATSSRSLVLFHSPDCGHCRAMMPVWEALGDNALANGVLLRSVDVTDEPQLADRLEVFGYPTLLLVEPGEEAQLYEFRGERTLEAIEAFAASGYLAETPRALPPEPRALDPLLHLPRDITDVVAFALSKGVLPALTIALGCMVMGALLATAVIGAPRPAAPQFVTVTMPPDLAAGQPFNVELPPAPYRSWWERRRSSSVITVVAPAGIAPGQTFFVPLVSCSAQPQPSPPVAASRVGMKAKSS